MKINSYGRLSLMLMNACAVLLLGAISMNLSGCAGSSTTAVTLSSIAVTPTSASLDIGASQQFTATGTYSDATTADLTSSVTWNSSDAAVATISAVGLASGLAEGTSNITASLNSLNSDAVTLTVAKSLVSIAITPTSASFDIGANQQFTASGTYSDATTANLTSQVTWHSSDSAVATISAAGLASGLAEGTSDVTASLDSLTSDAATLTVTNSLVSIAITPTTPIIGLSVAQQFTALGTYSDASVVDLTASVTWNSSSASTATLSAQGLATTLTAGSSTVTATLDGVTSNEVDFQVRQVWAYVANGGNNSVSICPLNADGSLDACTFSTGNATFNNPKTAALTADGTIAYVVNRDGNNVSICPVEADGDLGVCTTSDGDTTIISPLGANTNPAGDLLYVTNGNDTMTICQVGIGGALSGCILDDGGGGVFNTPHTVRFSNDGEFAYVANVGGVLTICSVNADGTLAVCTQDTGDGFFNVLGGASLNADGTAIYVASYGLPATVTFCPVNENGSLGSCVENFGNGTYDFSAFRGIALWATLGNGYLYVPDAGSNQLSICPLNNDDSIGTCVTSADATFNVPTSVVLSFIP